MSQAIDRALAHLDEAGLIATLATLVQTPSVYQPDTPGANEERAARRVADLLQSWGLEPQWEVAAPGRPNVMADLSGTRPGRCLLFEAHTDVVTPGDRNAWTHDPFGAEVVDGRMYGRGSADMKAGLAAMLYATHAIQSAGVPLKGRIRLAVLSDEEGLMLGAKHFVTQGHAQDVQAVIVCEPEEGEVCIAQKGALRLRLVSYGRIAHGAMPETGINALAGMTRLLARLLDLQTRLQAEYGVHPLLGKPYVTPTILRAPLNGDISQLNCLPGACDAYLDIRSVPAFSHEQVRGWIQAEIDTVRGQNPQFHFDVETIDDRPATETDPEAAIVRAVLDAHQAVYGQPAAFGGVPGSTDGTILWRAHRMPMVTYGPGDKLIPHQPDEFVRIAEVIKAARVYIISALTYLEST